MATTATTDRTAELEQKIAFLTEKIALLTEQIAFLTEEAVARLQRRKTMEELQVDLTPIAKLLDSMMIQLESMHELITDIAPIIGRGVELAITKAGELEERGYIGFATAGIGVVDRIVTNFSKEDLEALAGKMRDPAKTLVTNIGIGELTDDHWKVITFLRSDFQDQGETATLRRVATIGGIPTKSLFQLFPKKPARKMSYVAGLQKPKGCI